MHDDKSRDDEENDLDEQRLDEKRLEEQRQSTFLHESDLPSDDQVDPIVETRAIGSGRRDTLGEQSDSMLGETVTLSNDDSSVLGNFRLISKLGSGGFGTVYKAEDLRLDRFVAIKAALARPADRGDEQFKRVLHEGRAAAALDHPNIVSIYDVAQLEGKPYIISQLIDGITLKEWKASEGFSIKSLAKILIQVARAVDYAHDKGVIHRDLKPGNILMDVDGVPYVNDFGIAKHNDAEETISQESSIIGTPAYMSPEQASGHSREADRRSDLYSLGVMLFELTTGEKPFRGHSKMLIHHVIHTEPQPPRSLDQSVPRDLETICLKCLEKDPARRYQSCAELADELQRFVDGEPIKARPISSFEHFVRRCKRHPTTTAITSGLIAAIALGLVGVTWQWRRAESSRRDEAAARIEADASRKELAQKVAFSNQMLHDAESKLAFNSMTAGDHRHANKALIRLLELGDLEYELIRNVQRRCTEWYRHPELIRDIAISDNEKYIAAAGLRTLLVWDADTGQIVYRFREKQRQLRCVVFQPNSALLAWGGQSGQLHTKRVDKPGDKPIKRVHGAEINAICFSQDGQSVATTAEDGSAKVWSTSNLEKLHEYQPTSVAINAVDFANQVDLLVGTAEGTVFLCDQDSGQCEPVAQSRASIVSLDVHDDGVQFAAGTRDNRVFLGRIGHPEQSRLLTTSYGPIVDVEFWESKDALVTTNLFSRLSIWKLPDLTVRQSQQYFQGAGRFAIAEKSDRIVVGGGDGAVVSFEAEKIRPDLIQLNAGSIRDLLFTDKTLVVCQDSGPASVLDPKTGRLLRHIPDPSAQDNGQQNDDQKAPPKNMMCVDSADSTSSLSFGTDDGRILVWQSESGRTRVHGKPNGKAISQIRVFADGAKALTGGIDGSLRLWDLSQADASESIAALGGVIRGLAISPDARHAVAVSANGIAVLIDLTAQRIVRRANLRQPLHSVAWSDDGSHVAIGGNRGAVLIYGRGLVQTTATIEAHNGAVVDVAYSPSGNRLVTIGNDDQLTFSNLTTKRSAAVVEGSHSSSLRALALRSDGNVLATGDAGGEIRIWSLVK